ncbi:hypothetical protein L2E82_13075 [Cichorium intybus]|uniref:Uncharacterized protein n=1 Tax=Cichorium intybus TaxID=13427 RepID=A0ACB9GIL2_CICIN|nr:hypothetical protein L2E82_13075 [Cichorium intybus]
MANHTTLLVLSFVVLSMVTIGRCSWISGGAPPPASVGDYMELGDELTDRPSPSPNGDSITQGKDELAPGPTPKEADGPGPAGEFMIQGKRYIWEGFGDVGGDFINQNKESVPPNEDTFIIQGKVYCDPCRIQFPTKISFALAGTKVILVCHKVNSDEETYRVEGMTDEKGNYKITAVGDHAEEICEITVTDSPDINCPELMDDENHVRVSLTNKHGVKGKGRFANPLGFMSEVADPRCKEALDELGFTGI